MREILFRGKHLATGEWLYGAYCDETNEATDFPCIIPKLATAEVDEWEVDLETVGQYTGLTDKHGKRIFEGDIVEAHYDDLFPGNVSRMEIVWNVTSWGLHQAGYPCDILMPDDSDDLTIIGNIHDNPELMEA